MKKLVSIFLWVFINSMAIAQPIITYTISFDEPQSHYVQVSMEINNWNAESINVSLPVWAPGSYMVREFAKNVEGFNTTDSKGTVLFNEKISKSTWRVSTAKTSAIKINYRVYAYELSVRTSFIDNDQAFLNGSSIFMYIDKMLNLPSTIKIIPAKHWKQITTTLENVNGNKWMFTAPDYDLLADSPIEIGNHELITFGVGGVPHEVAMIGEGNYSALKIKEDFKKIVEETISIFGELPCKRYVFFIQNHSAGGGGLEHLNSTSIVMNRSGYQTESVYNGFLSTVAHEYFHLWNVKRLRPKTLLPYDYANENYTTLLYVAEGFTAYYDDLIIQRCGIVSDVNYLSTLSGSFTYVDNNFADTIQSLTESSFDAWIKYYRPNENSLNTSVSYYTKGSLIALMVDLSVMDATDGKKSLDDVMQFLYNEYYKKQWIGYTETDLINAVKTVSGVDMNDFFLKHVHSTQRINYNFYLEKAGVILTKKEVATATYIGANTSYKESKLLIMGVDRNSPAWKDGLNVNDELLAIDNTRIGDDLSKAIAFKKAGDTVSITVNRNGLIKDISVLLTTSPKSSYSLDKMEKPTEKQLKIYKKWLRLD